MTTNATTRVRNRLRRTMAALVCVALLLTGCLPGTTPSPTPTVPATHVVPPVNDPPIGSDEPTPLQESLLMLRRVRDGSVAGAAIVATEDGLLLTIRADDEPVELVRPDGSSIRPVRITRDDATGLTLMKTDGSGLTPARFAEALPETGTQVFATGFDGTSSSFGQMGGTLVALPATSATPTPDTTPGQLHTDIPLIEGFTGGALADESGALVGLITHGHAIDGTRVVTALPASYLTDWVNQWRAEVQQIVQESEAWPIHDAGGGFTLRYPSGWSVVQSSGDARSYQGEIVPNDPDVPLRIGLSIQSSSFKGNPLDFVAQEFGDRKDIRVWGTVTYGGINGVRVILDQEGARVDVVYLFHDNRQIAVSLTSGSGPDAVDPQAQRAELLFEAVVRSIGLPRRPVG